MNELARPEMGAIESVIALGDLSKLSSEQRVKYYLSVCQSLGLIEQLFLTGTTSFGLSQVIHGARDLRAGDK